MLVVDDDHGLTKPATLKTAGKAIAEFLDLRRTADAGRFMCCVCACMGHV